MDLDALIDGLLPSIEAELRQVVQQAGGARLNELHHMLAYHLGWEGEGAGPQASGKRIRPLLVLLTCGAAGGDWQRSLPAAAAVELVHNFSLIHDDIQDNGLLRRGRPTVWTKWGVAQAINAGDAMFALAQIALLRLRQTASPAIALEALHILLHTCLHLTQGQYLDIAYERAEGFGLEAYWEMVAGKTAALIAACTELGALVAEVPEARRAAFRRFGERLGLAFQAQDDLLGIWGDQARTGKSAQSDLLSGKKTLPVLYGLSCGGAFAARMKQGALQPDEIPHLAAQLEAEGGRQFTEETVHRLTEQALHALEEAQPSGEMGHALRALALRLLKRQA